MAIFCRGHIWKAVISLIFLIKNGKTCTLHTCTTLCDMSSIWDVRVIKGHMKMGIDYCIMNSILPMRYP